MPPSDYCPPAVAGTAPCKWCKDLLILTLVTALWFCALLGVRPLSNPDEGRYTEIPREMAATGDFVTPRLNGVKYFEKPPLVYWLSALTFREFGVNQFTARLWGGIFSMIGVLLTYAAGRVIYGRAAGIAAAVVLATTLIYYALSQIMLLDMAVAVTMSGALFAFILAMREPRGRRRFGLFMVFYIFMALATLSKGLIGFALPGAVIFLWVLLLNRWRALWPFYPIVGTILLLAIAAPWHILAAQANHSDIKEHDFAWFYFIHEHWLRFTTRIHGRYEPWWFFLPIFLVGLFPWIFFTAQTWRDSFGAGWKSRKENSEAWFFLIWTVFIVAFFSKSQSKLIPYILPVFPAVAVLIGRSVAGAWIDLSAEKFRRSGWAFVITAGLLAGAVIFYPTPDDQPDIAAKLPLLRATVSCALLLGAAATVLGLRRNQPRFMLGAIAMTSTAFMLALNLGGGDLDKASTKKFAMMLKPILKADDRVYSVGIYAQDLPAYLGRLVSVVDYQGELQFGIEAEAELTARRFLDREDFFKQWNEAGGAYAVIRINAYNKWFSNSGIPCEMLLKTDRYVLVAKRPQP